MFAGRTEHAVALYSNRGTSGIDGLLATAAGCALGGKAPVTLLIGDLSLLHDLSSLGLVQRIRVPFIIVVLNNDGGGIFRLLPVPEEEGLLERLFQLPHGLAFAGACNMFELDYVCPQSRAHFVQCYTAALKQPRATVIEVKVSSRQTVEMIKALCRCSSELDFPRNEQ
jgi:2-succinyl-5-enolpyruvyl-6-hydroxy-3-cyclohexene-1-carboxylate synthase